jgi:hypothetical protein
MDTQIPFDGAVIGPRHGNVRLRTLRHLDGRTRAAKRARALVRYFENALGGDMALPIGTKIMVETAAVLAAIAQDTQARRLAGEPIPLDEVIRASRCARLALKDLGLLDFPEVVEVEPEPEPVPVPAESAREQIERGIAEAMAKRSDNADAD